MTTLQRPRTVTLLATAAVAAVVLTACGTSSGSAGTDHMGVGMGSSSAVAGMGSDSPTTGATGPATGPHDSTDVAFVRQMIPHHMQAVAMAELAATRGDSAQLKTLAGQIRAAQTSEIAQMSSWLRGWGASTSIGSMSSDSPSAGTGMGGDQTGGDQMSGTGMMSDADMARLATLRGTAFDRSWLTMMTSHHQGALTMARTELKTGTNGDAKGLARSIITSQTAQITEMNGLLAGLPAS